jgi:acyl-CoA hydrolase
MSHHAEAYRSRLVSYEELVAGIQPGSSLLLGTWLGQPHGMMRALCRFGQHIDPLYISTSPASAVGELLNQPNVFCSSTFLGPHERAARRVRNNVFYTPLQYTDARKALRTNRPPDYVIVRTAPPDDHGSFNLSLASSWAQYAIPWFARHAPATHIVVEVNPHMPHVPGLEEFGNNRIPLSDVHVVVEDDTPPAEFVTPEPTETDVAIAANVTALIDDRATIQLGIGSIPMVIGKLLRSRKNLGIHTEMFCQSHLDLIEAGSVSNDHKGVYDGVSVATFALGEQRLYRWLADNREFAMLPVEEVNAIPVLARVENMTSINSVLSIDLSGQSCAHCLGSQTFSGVGGAFEFAYGSQFSPGGKSILCLPSRRTLRDGREVSNIVARHAEGARVTIPEHCVDWVVTEFGAVRLKFLNLEWRAAALIRIAHPRYRDELTEQALATGLRLSELSRHRAPPEHFFSSTD